MAFIRLAACAMAVAGLAIGLAQAQTTPAPAAPGTAAEVIATRQAGMKKVGDDMAAIKKALDAGQDVGPLAAQAKEVADWGRKIPSMFPPGTEAGSKAKPEAWSDRPGFEKAAAGLAAEADKLAQLASANDKSGFVQQYQATGGACGTCHRTYRNR